MPGRDAVADWDHAPKPEVVPTEVKRLEEKSKKQILEQEGKATSFLLTLAGHT